MITEPTVLILGAGASAPYGYPTGRELRDAIIDLRDRIGGRAELYNKALGDDHAIERMKRFIDVFQSSGNPSIDLFLSERLNEFGLAGKVAIATILKQREDPKKVFATGEGGYWYYDLWMALRNGTWNPEDIRKNELSIITFNYDRSLEYFLISSIVNSFGLDEEEAVEIASGIPIFHVYGSLGPLPFQTQSSDDPLPYEPKRDGKVFRQCADSIRIVSENSEHEDMLHDVQMWIRKARRLCFLGFGYLAENLDRLGLDQGQLSAVENQYITGTLMGLSFSQYLTLSARIGVPGFKRREFTHSHTLECRELIHQSGIFRNTTDDSFAWH